MENQIIIDKQIQAMQENLADLRKLCGFTVEELGMKLGLKKQSITNIEHYKESYSEETKSIKKEGTKLSQAQYLALRFIFHNEAYDENNQIKNEGLARALISIFADINKYDDEKEVIKTNIKVLASIASGTGQEEAKKRAPSMLPIVGTATVGTAALFGLFKIISSLGKKH